MNTNSPTPFLLRFVLTQEQLTVLTEKVVSRDKIDRDYCGDPVLALDSRFLAQKMESYIAPIIDYDAEIRFQYLYILDILSWDGKPPKVEPDEERLSQLWRALDCSPHWKNVTFTCRTWPNDPGLPEPKQWLRTRMYTTIRRMQEARGAE